MKPACPMITYGFANASRSIRASSRLPLVLAARHALRASCTNRSSAASGIAGSRSSSSHPAPTAQWRSIWRASASPMGLVLLICDHMLGEISSLSAKSLSSPLAGSPAVMACSRKRRCRARVLWRRTMVMLDTNEKATTVKRKIVPGIDERVNTIYITSPSQIDPRDLPSLPIHRPLDRHENPKHSRDTLHPAIAGACVRGAFDDGFGDTNCA